ncbi:MAG: tetratricopeptide repeat protein [Lysobacterales bacterium]
MNMEVLKSVGMVAGIGGVALGVMLLVLRDIIKKNIFPKFKVEKNAYRLLRLIVVSVWTVALLGIVVWGVTAVMNGREGDTINVNNNNYSTDMVFADYKVIVNQYQEIHGQKLPAELMGELRKAINLLKGGQYKAALPAFQQLSEAVEVPAVYNNVGGLLALESNPDAARAEYVKSIALDPEYETTQLNLGLLEQSQGNYDQAELHLSKADSFPEARTLLRNIVEHREAGAFEKEPNNDQFQPNVAPLDEAIQASIKDEGDKDFYEISMPGDHRDYVSIDLQNQNLQLKPRIGLFSADREWLGGTSDSSYQVTSGQNLKYLFVAQGGMKYLIRVTSLNGSGPYNLKIAPQHAFDQYEPNENLFSSKPIAIEIDVEANIMDENDRDYYSITLGPVESEVKVTLQNQSQSLKPRVGVYRANDQRWLGGTSDSSYQVNYGQNVSYSFQGDAGIDYYVMVRSLQGSGNYVLRVEQS